MPEVALTLTTPAALGAGTRSGWVHDTFRYLPGSVVRGAFAAAWIARYGVPNGDPAFIGLFERGVTWGPLHKRNCEPAPLTQWRHKYGKAPAECPPWWDDLDGDVPGDRECPQCHQPLECSKGSIEGVDMVGDAHVQLTETGTADEGQLFSHRRVAADQTFVGYVSGPPALTEFLADVGDVWLGGRRSTGGGRATVQVQAGDPPALEVVDGKDVVLVLRSPGVFVDDFGRPADAPRTDELSSVLGTEVDVDAAAVRWESSGGWHAASGLPKSTERAVSAGSVYRVRCADRPAVAALCRLAWRGVGLRRAEGFGAVGPRPRRPLSSRQIQDAVAPLVRLSVDKPQAFDGLMMKLKQLRDRVASGESPGEAAFAHLLADRVPQHVRGPVRFLLGLGSASEIDVAITFLRSGGRIHR